MNPGQTPYPVFDQATLDAMLGVGAVPSVPSSSVPFPTAGVESAYSMLSLGPQLSFETDGGDADAAFASEPVGKTGRRRVRVTKACDACSKKKIKCDGLQPACTRCFVNNIACAYSRDTKKRGPAPGSIVSLHKRLKRLEYLLEKATGGKGEEFFDELEDGAPDDEDHESGHSDDDALEAVNIKQEPEAEPRRIKPATGTVMPKPGKVQGPGASAAKLPVEQELPRDAQSPVSPQESPGADLVADFVSGGPTVLILDAASPAQAEPLFAGSSGQVVKQMMAPIRARSVGGQLAGSPPHGVVPLPRSPSGSLFDDLPRLPPQEILDSLVADYFAHLGPATSFIHRQTFMRNLRAQPPLLLYSIYAVAAPYSEKIGANRFEFAASMFERAKRLLYPALELPPSLVTIQALLHLVLYGVTSWAHGAIAYQFTGIAIMMARQMLLNLDPDSDRFSKEATRRNMRWVEKETRRRVWWALYNLDRITAVAANRSCIISDNECLTSLPCNPILWDFDLPGGADTESFAAANFPAWVALFLSNPEEPLPDLMDADPYLYECMLNNVVGKIVEFHLWCTFREINPFNPPNNALGAAARTKMELVDNMLAKWQTLLPDSLKVLRPALPGSRAVLPWMLLFLRTAIVLLHCPRDTNMLKLEKDISWLSGDSFVRCSEESTHVAKLLEDMLKASPNLDGAVPFAIFCIFQTGLIHLVGIKNLQQQMIMACGTPECGGQELVDLVNEAKRQLEIHLRALTVLSRRWRTAERLATLVSKLLVDIEAPLVTGFGLLISEENEAGEKLFALLEIPEDMEAPMQAAACPVPHRSQVTQALPIPADDVLQFISGEDFELPE